MIAAVWSRGYNGRMAILLFSDPATCVSTLAKLSNVGDDALRVLLFAGDGSTGQSTPLANAMADEYPDLLVVDVNSERFPRLNFDVVRTLIPDMAAEVLLSAPGRRLVDVLGKLASDGGEDALDLALVSESVTAAGARLSDGLHAGLTLLPDAVVIHSLAEVGDLRALLAAVSAESGRLLALDAPVAVRYDAVDDAVRVAGTGSVLLVTFAPGAEGAPASAKLHVVAAGNRSSWPA